MAAAYFEERRDVGSDPARYFATGTLAISYKRPTPMDTVLELEAEIAGKLGNGYRLICRLSAAGKLCATGDVKAVPVSADWMGVAV
jgi:hypothetical protein